MRRMAWAQSGVAFSLRAVGLAFLGAFSKSADQLAGRLNGLRRKGPAVLFQGPPCSLVDRAQNSRYRRQQHGRDQNDQYDGGDDRGHTARVLANSSMHRFASWRTRLGGSIKTIARVSLAVKVKSGAWRNARCI